MPIRNYSVLKGRPTSGKVVTGRGTHYQIRVEGLGGPYTVAVNIESQDGSEVLFAIEHNFTPPDAAGLGGLQTGMTRLKSEPGGLALDFVREESSGRPMISLAEMTLLPKKTGQAGKHPDSLELRAAALTNGVTMLIGQAIKDSKATIYAFGSAYADAGQVDGIHDIHMNQGNPVAGGHGGDNGTWQDGALMLQLPSLSPDPAKQWVAVFLAFQTQSWDTDENGNPV